MVVVAVAVVVVVVVVVVFLPSPSPPVHQPSSGLVAVYSSFVEQRSSSASSVIYSSLPFSSLAPLSDGLAAESMCVEICGHGLCQQDLRGEPGGGSQAVPGAVGGARPGQRRAHR